MSKSIFEPSLPDGLTMGSPDCVDIGGVWTCTCTLEGQALVGVGTHDYSISASDGDLESDTNVTLIVEPEDTRISFDDGNQVAEQVTTPGGASGLFSLTVHIWELIEPIGQPGDIDLAEIEMRLVPVGPGTPAEPLDCWRNTDGTEYNAVLTFTCSFIDVPVNTYTVEVAVNGEYYQGYKEDVLVVHDPSLGFATGGGWFYWPGTEDSETGYLGNKTNFGFTMKYNKKATNIQGNLLLIKHLPDGSIYRTKSNALYGLALGEEEDECGENFGWASFSGKNTYLEPGWPEPEGNHEFKVYVEDHNEPVTGIDTVWIEALDKDGLVIEYMFMLRPATDNTNQIQGGNLVVPQQGW